MLRFLKTHILQLPALFLSGLMVFCVVFASGADARAVYNVKGNTADITMKIDPDTDYKIDYKDNRLQISFSRPYATELNKIDTKLTDFIDRKVISADGKNITLDMSAPVTVRNNIKDNILTISVEKQNEEQNLPDLSALGNGLRLSYGEHDAFVRFVFEYNQKPQYNVITEDNRTVISFLNDVNITSVNLKNYPDAGKITKAKNKAGGIDIMIPEHLIETSEFKNKLVFDMEKDPEAAPRTPVVAESTSKIGGHSQLENAQISEHPRNEVASLSFPWNMPVGVSVFQRNDYIWVIFDHNQKVDVAEISKTAANVADEVIQIPHNKATVLRFKPKADVKVGLRKEGLLWIIDLYTHDVAYNIRELPIFTQYNSIRQAYLYIPTVNAGTIISVVDPEIGDAILAAPNIELGVGVNNSYQYPDFEILAAKQGLAIIPNTSDIVLSRGNTGISIKGYDRGLNISDDLEAIKRQQLLGNVDGLANFDLFVSPQLLKMNFNEAEEQLKQDIEKAPQDQKIAAEMELAKYYISQGLGTNALKILNKIKTSGLPAAKSEKLYALLGAANFLAKRYDEAVEDFSYGKLPNYNEAVFWRTLASTAKEFKKEDNVVLFSFMSVMKDYAQELKERIALVGAEAAIKAGDDLATQNFMDVLKSTQGGSRRKAHILYLNAQKFELQGYPRNALREYNNIVYMDSQKYSSLARFAKTNLELKLGVISNDKAIKEYERLRYAWGETGFKLRLLDKLAATYAANKDYYSALKTYKEASELAPAEMRDEISDKMVKLFENVYLNNLADNMPPLKALAMYQDFEWLAPKSRQYSEIVQRLADRLVAVDLLDRASGLLTAQLRRSNVDKLQRNKIGARLALIYLFQEDNIEALKVLDKTEFSEAPETIRQHRKIIRAKALSNLNRKDDALQLLDGDFSKSALLLTTDIYWKQAAWDKAADTIKYLIEKPVKDKTLSDEQITYILDWATALKKAGRETVIIRLRNKFLPYFENSPYYSVFNVLTSNLEKDKIDIKSINQTINDIAAFSDFSKIYNQALRTNNLDKEPK